MANYSKWIGGGLGFVIGGPIGAIIGFFVGSAVDGVSTASKSGNFNRSSTMPGDFAVSLMVLTAVVIKANNKVKKVELDYVKRFLVHNFGEEKAQEAILMLRDILKKEVDVKAVCEQMKYNIDSSSRLQLIHYVFGIASADGVVDNDELHIINQISNYLGISASDFESVKSMFVKDTNALYKILGVDESASNDEIKKAYKSMAKKHHPDKVAHLGEDVQKAAKEKFQKISDAYDKIKKQRSFV